MHKHLNRNKTKSEHKFYEKNFVSTKFRVTDKWPVNIPTKTKEKKHDKIRKKYIQRNYFRCSDFDLRFIWLKWLKF